MKSRAFFYSSIVFVLLCTGASPVFAHKPTYVDKQISVEVKNPDISQAFYGELAGESVTYTVFVPESLNVYTGLLVPDQESSRIDVVVDMYNSKQELMYTLKSDVWNTYFEEFARDDYLKGPEYKTVVPAGKYTLVVSNPDNQGKYVLVIGTKERFLLQEMPRIFDQLIKVKMNTFGKPWYSAFMNIFGIGTGIILLFLVGIVVLIQRVVFRKKKKR